MATEQPELQTEKTLPNPKPDNPSKRKLLKLALTGTGAILSSSLFSICDTFRGFLPATHLTPGLTPEAIEFKKDAALDIIAAENPTWGQRLKELLKFSTVDPYFPSSRLAIFDNQDLSWGFLVREGGYYFYVIPNNHKERALNKSFLYIPGLVARKITPLEIYSGGKITPNDSNAEAYLLVKDGALEDLKSLLVQAESHPLSYARSSLKEGAIVAIPDPKSGLYQTFTVGKYDSVLNLATLEDEFSVNEQARCSDYLGLPVLGTSLSKSNKLSVVPEVYGFTTLGLLDFPFGHRFNASSSIVCASQVSIRPRTSMLIK